MGTNIRTLLLTFIAVGSVHAQFRTPGDPTGTTALLESEMARWPVSAASSNTFGAFVSPAPFGLTQLSNAQTALVLPALRGAATLSGRTGGGWTDIELAASHYVDVVPSFSIGAQVIGGFAGASGFSARVWASYALQAVLSVSSSAMVSASYEESSNTMRLAGGANLGIPISASMTIVPDRSVSLTMSALIDVIDEVTTRLSVATKPLTASTSLRLRVASETDVMVTATYVAHLGMRTMLGVEW